jgi:hypothetical protein
MNSFIYLRYPNNDKSQSNDGKLHRIEPSKLYDLGNNYYLLKYIEEEKEKETLLQEIDGTLYKVPLDPTSYKLLPIYAIKGKKINLKDTKLPNKIELIDYDRLVDFDLPLLKPLRDVKSYERKDSHPSVGYDSDIIESPKTGAITKEEQPKPEVYDASIKMKPIEQKKYDYAVTEPQKNNHQSFPSKTIDSVTKKEHTFYVSIGPKFDSAKKPNEYFVKGIYSFTKNNDDSIMLVKDILPKNKSLMTSLLEEAKKRKTVFEFYCTDMDGIQYNSSKKGDYRIVKDEYHSGVYDFYINYILVDDEQMYQDFLDAKFISLRASKDEKNIDTSNCQRVVCYGADKKPFARYHNETKHIL